MVHDAEVPAVFMTDDQERMYQLSLEGAEYEMDNRMVYHKLKLFLINGPSWVWIEPYDAIEDG